MTLDPALEPARLYQALADEVNPSRPVFTGDVFSEVDIPGVGIKAAIVIGHPCSIRGVAGRLVERTPVAAIREHELVAPERWAEGYFKLFPLPGLPLPGNYHAAQLDQFGLALTADLTSADRLACLSHPGINLLQQRLVFHQTRLAVPTQEFQRAFDHTYEEADLLEEWATDLGRC